MTFHPHASNINISKGKWKVEDIHEPPSANNRPGIRYVFGGWEGLGPWITQITNSILLSLCRRDKACATNFRFSYFSEKAL